MMQIPSTRREPADSINPFSAPAPDFSGPTRLIAATLVGAIVAAFAVGAALILGGTDFGLFGLIAALSLKAPAAGIAVLLAAWFAALRISA